MEHLFPRANEALRRGMLLHRNREADVTVNFPAADSAASVPSSNSPKIRPPSSGPLQPASVEIHELEKFCAQAEKAKDKFDETNLDNEIDVELRDAIGKAYEDLYNSLKVYCLPMYELHAPGWAEMDRATFINTMRPLLIMNAGIEEHRRYVIPLELSEFVDFERDAPSPTGRSMDGASLPAYMGHRRQTLQDKSPAPSLDILEDSQQVMPQVEQPGTAQILSGDATFENRDLAPHNLQAQRPQSLTPKLPRSPDKGEPRSEHSDRDTLRLSRHASVQTRTSLSPNATTETPTTSTSNIFTSLSSLPSAMPLDVPDFVQFREQVEAALNRFNQHRQQDKSNIKLGDAIYKAFVNLWHRLDKCKEKSVDGPKVAGEERARFVNRMRKLIDVNVQRGTPFEIPEPCEFINYEADAGGDCDIVHVEMPNYISRFVFEGDDGAEGDDSTLIDDGATESVAGSSPRRTVHDFGREQGQIDDEMLDRAATPVSRAEAGSTTNESSESIMDGFSQSHSEREENGNNSLTHIRDDGVDLESESTESLKDWDKLSEGFSEEEEPDYDADSRRDGKGDGRPRINTLQRECATQ